MKRSELKRSPLSRRNGIKPVTRSKKCHRCGETLSTESFHRDPSKSDGLYPSCKSCRLGRFDLNARVWRLCACGTLFQPRQNKGKYVQSCSRACAKESGLWAGEAHPKWQAVPNYTAMHQRLRARPDKGTRCRECNATNRALHWSLNHDRAVETLDSEFGPYSVNPDDYDVLCVPCHKRRDLDAIKDRAA